MSEYVIYIAVAFVMAFLVFKYYAMKLSVVALLWWLEEKKYKQPTREEIDACKEKFLRHLIK